MSFNVDFEIREDNSLVFLVDSSYVETAPKGRYSVSGHHVEPEHKSGVEWLSVLSPTNLLASAQHSVKFLEPEPAPEAVEESKDDSSEE